MAELPRFFQTQPTPRIGPGRSAQTIAPLQRISPGEFAQEGQAVAGLGQAVAGIGQVIAEIDQRFAAARALTDAEDAQTLYLGSIEEAKAAQLNQRMPDMEAFQAQLKAERDRIAADLGPLAQQRFLPASGRAFAMANAGMADEVRRRTVTQGKDAFERTTRRFDEAMAVAPPEAIPELEAAFRENSAAFVVTGIIQPGAVDAAIRDVNVGNLRVQMRQTPDLVLTRLMAGPIAGITAAEQTELIDEAQTEARQALDTKMTLEQQSTVLFKRGQEVRANTHRAIIEDPTTSTAELQAQMAEINREAIAREVTGSFQREALASINRVVTLRQNPIVKENESTKLDLGTAIELARTPSDFNRVFQDVLQADGLSSTTVPAFLRRISARRAGTDYSARESYQEGQRLILGASFPAGIVEVQMERLQSAGKKKLFAALELYRQTMEGIAGGPEGFVAVDREARKQALAIRDLYYPQGMKIRDVPAIPSVLQIRTAIPSATPGGRRTLGPIDVDAAKAKLETLPIPENLKDTFFEALEAEEKAQADVRIKQEAKDQEGAEEATRDQPGFFNSVDKWFRSFGGQD